MYKSRLVAFIKSLLKDTRQTSWELLKITIPVVIITKVLEELGLIVYLSNFLEPVMNIIGLPGELGLVWATALFTNLYGAMIVFATLAPELNISVAQATVLCSAMLIAHSLPLELAITKKAGASLTPIALLRLTGAFIYGFLLNALCQWLQIWQGAARIIFTAEKRIETHLAWVLNQLENFVIIIFVIFCILFIMRLLKIFGILSLLERFLEPVLPPLGMTKRAAPVTVVGMVMGISYGGALIIRETNSGSMSRKEVFFSLALMGLCHSLVEDTLLMVALGGHIGGILIGRIFFSLVVIYLLARLSNFSARRLEKKQCRLNLNN